MRITKKVFLDLTIFMIGFGLVVGIIFPIFVNVIGVPKVYIDVLFITSSIFAGVLALISIPLIVLGLYMIFNSLSIDI